MRTTTERRNAGVRGGVRSAVALAVGLACGVGGVVVGQPTPLDAGVEDVDAIRTSLRLLPDVFRADTGFEHVYRGPDGRLYRVAGALVAVFDESEYVATGGGVAAVAPGGTVYQIGLPEWLQREMMGLDGAGAGWGGTVEAGAGGGAGAGGRRGGGGGLALESTPLGVRLPARFAWEEEVADGREVAGVGDELVRGEMLLARAWRAASSGVDRSTISDERTRVSRLIAIAAGAR